MNGQSLSHTHQEGWDSPIRYIFGHTLMQIENFQPRYLLDVSFLKGQQVLQKESVPFVSAFEAWGISHPKPEVIDSPAEDREGVIPGLGISVQKIREALRSIPLDNALLSLCWQKL